jgi:hypothetical protein
MMNAQQQQPLAVKQSLQGSRVKQELEALREKQLAKNQRDKFKDRTFSSLMNLLIVFLRPLAVGGLCLYLTR